MTKSRISHVEPSAVGDPGFDTDVALARSKPDPELPGAAFRRALADRRATP